MMSDSARLAAFVTDLSRRLEVLEAYVDVLRKSDLRRKRLHADRLKRYRDSRKAKEASQPAPP
jgi:hypothetical protein